MDLVLNLMKRKEVSCGTKEPLLDLNMFVSCLIIDKVGSVID